MFKHFLLHRSSEFDDGGMRGLADAADLFV
jgi:hypothetical protein